jgi:hypothetical protein
MLDTIQRPTISLVKVAPLATGTLYELKPQDLRVGDVVIVGNCVRTITSLDGTTRDWDGNGGFDTFHKVSVAGRGRGQWMLAAGRSLMVIR